MTRLALFTVGQELHLSLECIEGGFGHTSELSGNLQLGVLEWSAHDFLYSVFELFEISLVELFLQAKSRFDWSSVNVVADLATDWSFWNLSLKIIDGSRDHPGISAQSVINCLSFVGGVGDVTDNHSLSGTDFDNRWSSSSILSTDVTEKDCDGK